MKNERYCVIGHPIGHTMSPFIHKRLFEISGICAEYTSRDVNPDNIANDFAELKKLRGFNVTIPHKQAIIPLLDRLDKSATLCGAVNTVFTNGESVGYNTDMDGFTGALERAGIALCGRVLLCGTGGAARAVAFSAAKAGCEIEAAVQNGFENTAEALKNDILAKIGDAKLKIIHYDKISGEYDLAVNATPVGMYPNTNAAILSEEQIKNCKAIYDLVYNPRETLLLSTARKSGIKCDGGMSMLVLQAAKAHEIWYGAKFDREQISRIIDDATEETKRMFEGGGSK